MMATAGDGGDTDTLPAFLQRDAAQTGLKPVKPKAKAADKKAATAKHADVDGAVHKVNGAVAQKATRAKAGTAKESSAAAGTAVNAAAVNGVPVSSGSAVALEDAAEAQQLPPLTDAQQAAVWEIAQAFQQEAGSGEDAAVLTFNGRAVAAPTRSALLQDSSAQAADAADAAAAARAASGEIDNRTIGQITADAQLRDDLRRTAEADAAAAAAAQSALPKKRGRPSKAAAAGATAGAGPAAGANTNGTAVVEGSEEGEGEQQPVLTAAEEEAAQVSSMLNCFYLSFQYNVVVSMLLSLLLAQDTGSTSVYASTWCHQHTACSC
jgi:hypothetical protein